MNTRLALEELKLKIEPYLFFWEEWTQHDCCFLSKEEIHLAGQLREQNFLLPLRQRLLFRYSPTPILAINDKLKRRYAQFQEWVIFKFLCRLLQLDSLYGSDDFLAAPITELRLPEALKENLGEFKIHHLRQLAHAYNPEAFKISWVYANIVAFHRLDRKYQFHTHVLHYLEKKMEPA